MGDRAAPDPLDEQLLRLAGELDSADRALLCERALMLSRVRAPMARIAAALSRRWYIWRPPEWRGALLMQAPQVIG